MGMDGSATSTTWTVLAGERSRLVRRLVRRCGGLCDAEDWAQDAILRVATTMHAIDPERAGGLLSVVAWRIAIDEYRCRTRFLRAGARTATASTSPSPADVAEASSAVHELLEHIARLPERQRDVVSLVATGVPLHEVARRLGVSYRAAEGALRRGRETLRRTLDSVALAPTP
jgi:RNA polymerase sigma-70 factor (ECF subfamily)